MYLSKERGRSPVGINMINVLNLGMSGVTNKVFSKKKTKNKKKKQKKQQKNKQTV